MSVLARDLATDLRIEFQRRIESVDRSGRRWQLRSEVGLELEDVDAVIVATPAPQAVPLLAAAPGLARLAAGIEMLPCQAVMTTFGESPQVDFGGAFVSNSPLGWVARNASKPGRPAGECWVLHATPQWSAAHLEDSSEAVTESLLRALARALGRELPKVRSHRVHRWRFARTEKPLGSPYLWEAEAGLGVCGDWLHGSRVEDAFTSGELLARAMLGGPKRA
jgi:predicted NAD/FAD-dependent oxidoreductase